MRLRFSVLLLPLLMVTVNVPVSRATHPASLAADAPAPSPAQANLTTLMAKKGCKLFAGLLAAAGDVEQTFEENVGSGLTVFCPVDPATQAFMPRYKNLSGDGKVSLLLYHGIPVYNSMQMLKSGNGVVNTLATDGTSKDFNFTVQDEGEGVALVTRVAKAAITGTLIDQDPLAVYTIDEVLLPMELFKPALAPAPAPAPAAEKPGAEKAASSPPAPAPAPAGTKAKPADQKAEDNNVAVRECGGRWTAAAVMAFVAVSVLVV